MLVDLIVNDAIKTQIFEVANGCLVVVVLTPTEQDQSPIVNERYLGWVT